jgi:tetratricopeptide (TPR) repeat protein
MLVYLYGDVLPLAQARISPEDRAFLFADGIYEAVVARRGRLLFWDEHERRLRAGLATLRIELRDPAALRGVAEDLLRRAIKRAPGFPEARLHLGRVLLEQGQSKEALQELTQALSGIQDQNFQYFGQMFIGRAAAETGDATRARTAFERAALLAPAAQSPLIALSQLAYSRGDADQAAALLARVAVLPALENDDPWWFYSTTAGRFFPPSHQDLVESLRMEMPK